MTAAQARRALHDHVKALGLLKGQPDEWWSRLKDSGKQWHVRRQPYSTALERVEDTLREDEKKNAIVYGTLDDLRKTGSCWHVEDGGHKLSVIAYLDEKTGKLVFLWLTHEG